MRARDTSPLFSFSSLDCKLQVEQTKQVEKENLVTPVRSPHARTFGPLWNVSDLLVQSSLPLSPIRAFPLIEDRSVSLPAYVYVSRDESLIRISII